MGDLLMKTLLAIALLLIGTLAYAGDSNNGDTELDAALNQEQTSTKWETENKYLAQSTRATSSIGEDESALESDQVEYEVIEE